MEHEELKVNTDLNARTTEINLHKKIICNLSFQHGTSYIFFLYPPTQQFGSIHKW